MSTPNNHIRKYGIKYLMILTLLLCSTISFSQNQLPELENKSTKEIKSTAKNAIRLGDTYTALFYYEEWAKRKPENTSISFQVAELFRFTRNYVQAEFWYQKIVSAHLDNYPVSIFYLAQMQMNQEKYKEAKENFLKCKKVLRNIKDKKFRKLNKTGILSCDYALALKDSNNTAVITHLDTSINQPHVEFSPVVLDENTMLYGSLKDNGVNYYDVAVHDSMTIPLRKLYLAKKEGEKWISKGEFKGPFNVANTHVGNATVNESGDRIYFTLCEKNWKGKVVCDLYYSDKEGSEWQEAVKMNEMINVPNYTTTQPAIGRESKKNHEILYFVSDRPKGKGGLDIWYTEFNRKKKKYSTPKNAGSRINTPGTEFTPYYDISTHKLYFSSDGRVGIGGLDVYSIKGEKSRWEEAQNLKKEINSSADDFDYTFSPNHKGGFMVSNRKGGVALLNPTCCDDIYEFKLSEYIDINLIGKVSDSIDCLSNYKINIYINNKETEDRFLSKSIGVDSCDFKLGLEQGYDYTVEISKDGYLNGYKDISTTNINKSEDLNTSIQLKKKPKGRIVLPGILYDFNSPNLTAESKTSIDTSLYLLLIQNREIIIEISSHTDSKGTESYNMKLSQKRAESVVNYLLLKGINKKRLVPQGYGETMPIAPNKKQDGSDNPEGRKLNRRTDFQIKGVINLDDLWEDTPKAKKSNKAPKKKNQSF
jgi:OOP family OmpA-OmpF porin